MVGQKQRIIRRFEKASKVKNKKLKELGLQCICGKCNLATFTLQEAKDIITLKDEDEIRDPKQISPGVKK